MNRRLDQLRPVLPALAVAAFGIVRLPELTRSSLWYDELFSVGVAALPAGESLRRIIADHTNPPLFYLLLKGWMALGGDGDRWVRLLPCVLAMLLGAALVWLVREARAGAAAGTLAVALAAASPLSVDLANEVRAYSLLALLACLSLAGTLFDRRVRTRDSFALLTIINVALVHTHYFGWLTVGAELVVAACCWSRDDAWRMARSAAYALLAFLPWAAAVAAHAVGTTAPLRNVAWIGAPGLAAPLWFVRDLTGRSGNATADVVWLALVGVALVALVVTRWRRSFAMPRPATPATAATAATDAGTLILLAATGLGVPVVVWAVSQFGGPSIWVQRYLVGAAAPLALLTAIAIAALIPRKSTAAILGLAWAAIAMGSVPQRAPTKFDWRRFARRIDLSVGSPRDVYALEAFTAAPLEHYAPVGVRVHVIRALEELPIGDAWLVYRRESFAAGTPAEPLRALGVTVVTALSAETAGQRIVAMRTRR